MKAIIIILLCIAIFGTAGYFSYQMFVQPRMMAREEAALGTPTPPPDPSIPDFERCMKIKNGGNLADARSAMEAFIGNNPNSTKLDEAKTALGEINTDILFSTYPVPEKKEYIVQKGDVLVKIAAKTKTNMDLIVRSNNLDGTMLHIGDKLLISEPHFSVTVNRKEKTVTLYDGGHFFKQYKVVAWNVPVSKNPASITGKVGERIAWKNDQRVSFGSKDYAGSDRWIFLGVTAYTLYTDRGAQKPPAGLGMAPGDMEELSALLNRGVPVTIE